VSPGVLKGPARGNPSVACYREHEQPVGDEPERHYAQEPGSEGLAKKRLQGSSQSGGLLRIRPQCGYHEEATGYPDHYSPGSQAKSSPLRNQA
jgi:hypothetical protein